MQMPGAAGTRQIICILASFLIAAAASDQMRIEREEMARRLRQSLGTKVESRIQQIVNGNAKMSRFVADIESIMTKSFPTPLGKKRHVKKDTSKTDASNAHGRHPYPIHPQTMQTIGPPWVAPLTPPPTTYTTLPPAPTPPILTRPPTPAPVCPTEAPCFNGGMCIKGQCVPTRYCPSELFEFMDKKKHGAVRLDNYIRMANKLEVADTFLKTGFVEKTFFSFDTDNDKEITLKEFHHKLFPEKANAHRRLTDQCDETVWPDTTVTCSDCKVRVESYFKYDYHTCGRYCATVGRTCVGAWKEGVNICEEQSKVECDEVPHLSSAICECGPKLPEEPGCVDLSTFFHHYDTNDDYLLSAEEVRVFFSTYNLNGIKRKGWEDLEILMNKPKAKFTIPQPNPFINTSGEVFGNNLGRPYAPPAPTFAPTFAPWTGPYLLKDDFLILIRDLIDEVKMGTLRPEARWLFDLFSKVLYSTMFYPAAQTLEVDYSYVPREEFDPLEPTADCTSVYKDMTVGSAAECADHTRNHDKEFYAFNGYIEKNCQICKDGRFNVNPHWSFYSVQFGPERCHVGYHACKKRDGCFWNVLEDPPACRATPEKNKYTGTNGGTIMMSPENQTLTPSLSCHGKWMEACRKAKHCRWNEENPKLEKCESVFKEGYEWASGFSEKVKECPDKSRGPCRYPWCEWDDSTRSCKHGELGTFLISLLGVGDETKMLLENTTFDYIRELGYCLTPSDEDPGTKWYHDVTNCEPICAIDPNCTGYVEAGMEPGQCGIMTLPIAYSDENPEYTCYTKVTDKIKYDRDPKIQVSVTTDCNPRETFWSLYEVNTVPGDEFYTVPIGDETDGPWTLLGDGGPYEKQGEEYVQEVPISVGYDYVFIIIDFGGDGLSDSSCGHGAGKYSLRDMRTGGLVLQGGQFTQLELFATYISADPSVIIPKKKAPRAEIPNPEYYGNTSAQGCSGLLPGQCADASEYCKWAFGECQPNVWKSWGEYKAWNRCESGVGCLMPLRFGPKCGADCQTLQLSCVDQLVPLCKGSCADGKCVNKPCNSNNDCYLKLDYPIMSNLAAEISAALGALGGMPPKKRKKNLPSRQLNTVPVPLLAGAFHFASGNRTGHEWPIYDEPLGKYHHHFPESVCKLGGCKWDLPWRKRPLCDNTNAENCITDCDCREGTTCLDHGRCSSMAPLAAPSESPSMVPSAVPSEMPTSHPSDDPSAHPTTLPPSALPSELPSPVPSATPSKIPSAVPSMVPTSEPTPLDFDMSRIGMRCIAPKENEAVVTSIEDCVASARALNAASFSFKARTNTCLVCPPGVPVGESKIGEHWVTYFAGHEFKRLKVGFRCDSPREGKVTVASIEDCGLAAFADGAEFFSFKGKNNMCLVCPSGGFKADEKWTTYSLLQYKMHEAGSSCIAPAEDEMVVDSFEECAAATHARGAEFFAYKKSENMCVGCQTAAVTSNEGWIAYRFMRKYHYDMEGHTCAHMLTSRRSTSIGACAKLTRELHKTLFAFHNPDEMLNLKESNCRVCDTHDPIADPMWTTYAAVESSEI